MKVNKLYSMLRTLLLLSCGMMLMSFTVVIDAGHGGHDTGAIGLAHGTREKDLNLSVAQQLAQKISNKYPEVKVLLTRSTDVFLPLQKRADIANKNHADLFISIHTNAAENKNACGAETFILGTDRMEDNLDVAMRENAVMKMEDDQTVYQGFDPNSIESYILFELMQNQYMDNSLAFAELVQNQFVGTLKRANRGVRQAAFWVLLKSACPSVLIEMGFLSNADEEKWLASEEGKKGIVNGIFNAFEKYYK
jgi:N-acetylmuramoyl-L-alanine amidase